MPTSTRTVAFSYDGLQRLTGAAESPGSGFTYSYDAAGNLTGDGATSHGYDALGRLTGTAAGGRSTA